MFLVLENITLDKMPVLELLALRVFYLPALLHIFTLLFLSRLLHLCQSEVATALVLFAKISKHLILSLRHFNFEFPKLFLFKFHLFAELFKRIRIRVIIVIRII